MSIGYDGKTQVRSPRWAVDRGVRYPKKGFLDLVELTPSEQRQIVEALRRDYSVRQICETLGFNKSSLYYQPKIEASEEVLRTEIEELAARYPRYGYRRITKLLLRLGYTVGYRRVARLMKSANLSVSVTRICQTTRSLREVSPWVNRLQSVEVSRGDQVWVGNITYVRLRGHFVYGVSVLMDIFTRMIRTWHLSQHLTQFLTLKPLQEALRPSGVSRDPSQQFRHSISFKCLHLNAQAS